MSSGAIVIELKSDLRREQRDVEAAMPRYLADAATQGEVDRAVVGLVTDGATFQAYMLRGGVLKRVARYETQVEAPERLLAWLEPLIAAQPDIVPDPTIVTLAFGRQSLASGRARLAARCNLKATCANNSLLVGWISVHRRFATVCR